MRFIFRGIAIGLLAGALFFFFPFLLGVLFFFFIIRLLFGWGWRRSWRRRPYRYFGPPHSYPYDETIISIDGRGFVPPVQGRGGETHFPIQ